MYFRKHCFLETAIKKRAIFLNVGRDVTQNSVISRLEIFIDLSSVTLRVGKK